MTQNWLIKKKRIDSLKNLKYDWGISICNCIVSVNSHVKNNKKSWKCYFKMLTSDWVVERNLARFKRNAEFIPPGKKPYVKKHYRVYFNNNTDKIYNFFFHS